MCGLRYVPPLPSSRMRWAAQAQVGTWDESAHYRRASTASLLTGGGLYKLYIQVIRLIRQDCQRGQGTQGPAKAGSRRRQAWDVSLNQMSNSLGESPLASFTSASFTFPPSRTGAGMEMGMTMGVRRAHFCFIRGPVLAWKRRRRLDNTLLLQ